MKILFALSGLHRVHRGAEVAFTSIARELTKLGNTVTLMGSGVVQANDPYRFIHVPALPRERFQGWPNFPALRSQESWEDATFAPGLLTKFRPSDFDVTVTCAFPFTHWALRRPVFGKRPKHVFVTQNGDWPAHSNRAEFRLFKCDGLVCINPDYFERNRLRYRSALIPNGVDLERFTPGADERTRFGLPEMVPLVLMVSALIASKNVSQGIEAVARIPGAHLVVAGDGPLREELHRLAATLLPGRFHQITVPASDMPALYRCANLFMHLSLDESFGNVYVEALATGLPVVAWDCARTRWILGDDAPLAISGSLNALVKAITQALHPSLVHNVKSRERALNFGWRSVAIKYHDFFGDILQ
ncbi:glycosyltransferase family 4 protein [Sphingomonas limnosediminicola]|uniref:glycosyltransferase family 4 protein n=1 Tax=Sphingomonas limnosediminicola TaxID=940133 RepID=UPI0031DEF66C